MDRFKNKYRIESTRLKGWDYSSVGYYYVTVCTQDRICYFGDIVRRDAKFCVSLSKIGKIADKCWKDIPDHFPFVNLDAFVIMPNHIHGIIIIKRDDIISETQNLASLQTTLKQQ